VGGAPQLRKEIAATSSSPSFQSGSSQKTKGNVFFFIKVKTLAFLREIDSLMF